MADETGEPTAEAANHPSYDPAGEVVGVCQELIRMDTSNYGDDPGPGERKAAEYVAAQFTAVLDAVAAAPPPRFSGGVDGRPCTARWAAGTRSA